MSSKPFEVIIRRNINESGSVVAEIDGYLDAHTVIGFETQMNSLIEAGARRIIIDLEKLNYISSAGIGALIGLVQRLRRAGGDLVLVRPSQKVHKILNLLGFTEIFRIASNEDEALAVLRSESE